MNNNEAAAFLMDQIRSQAIKTSIHIDEPTEEIHLFRSGLFDSLSFVGLIRNIEDRFNIELDFADFEPEKFTTLSGLADMINQHLSSNT